MKIKSIIEEITQESFFDEEESNWYDGEWNCGVFENEKLIIHVEEIDGAFTAGIDHRSVFNKYSQCPIFFGFTAEKTNLPKRREKALLRAIEHLKTKEGQEQSATFKFPDFGDDLTREYYEI